MKYTSSRVWRLLVAGGLLAAMSADAFAMEGIQSPYLKGYRDFLSGVLPPPGVQVREDLYVYSGSERSTIPQGQLAVSYKTVTNILGATVVTPYRVFGGDFGFAVRGAYSDITADQALTPPAPRPAVVRSGSLDAFHDVVISPVIVGWHAGNWHWNVSASVWLPVGAYDKTRLVNTGKNYVAVSPQMGVTYLDPKSGWEFSGAGIFVTSYYNPATSYRSGDAIHVDLAAGKMLTSQFKLGVVGYWAQQLNGDSGAGAIFGDRKVRVAGVGPGATFTFVVDAVPVTLVAKYYREFDAQNTTQGDAGTLSMRVRF